MAMAMSERQRGATSPRRATVALETSTDHAVAGLSPQHAPSLYDKQLLWKQHGQIKLESRSHELLQQADSECTFAPKINQPQRSLRLSPATTQPALETLALDSDCSSQYSDAPLTMQSIDSMDLREYGGQPRHEMERGDVGERVPIHPTESQESSILLHLARQERAREEAHKARSKLWSTQPPKDFTKITTAKPFELSTTNRKPRRSLSTSPTHRSARPRGGSSSSHAIATHIASAGTNRSNGGASTPPKQASKRRPQAAAHGDDDGSDSTPAGSVESSSLHWQQERATLLSTIEMQRRELEQRELVQQEAKQLAESFADAVEAFEKRLEAVEKTTSIELVELKQLVARQTAATELILHALGLDKAKSPPASPPPPSAVTTGASTRRETK